MLDTVITKDTIGNLPIFDGSVRKTRSFDSGRREINKMLAKNRMNLVRSGNHRKESNDLDFEDVMYEPILNRKNLVYNP